MSITPETVVARFMAHLDEITKPENMSKAEASSFLMTVEGFMETEINGRIDALRVEMLDEADEPAEDADA